MMDDSTSRVIRSKAAARANYNRLSRWYDGLSSSETPYRQMGLQAMTVQAGERVLEIGFGTGASLLDLAAQSGSAGFVCGIDLSDRMAAAALVRIDQAGLREQVALTVGDAALPPFRADSFDAIFMAFTLELFDTPEIPQVLRECLRILRPGGRLAVVSLAKTASPNLAERVYEWFHTRMPVLVDCRPIMAQAALLASGFTITQVQAAKMWGLPVEVILAHR